MRVKCRSFMANCGVVGEICAPSWHKRRWGLIPFVAVLVVFSLLLVFASASGIGSFIYARF